MQQLVQRKEINGWLIESKKAAMMGTAVTPQQQLTLFVMIPL